MGAPKLRRLLATALAFLWIAAPVVAVVHGLSTEHAYCAEHDAIEERGESSGIATPSFGEDRVHGRAVDDGRGGAHEACSFAALVPTDPRSPADKPGRIAAARRSTPIAVADRGLLAPIPPLSNAPKQSPPRA